MHQRIRIPDQIGQEVIHSMNGIVGLILAVIIPDLAIHHT
jgi:hypothetical protein